MVVFGFILVGATLFTKARDVAQCSRCNGSSDLSFIGAPIELFVILASAPRLV